MLWPVDAQHMAKMNTGRVGPDPQTIYRDTKGDPIFYVRTELRSGRPAPEHLFVKTQRRACFQLWVSEIPEKAELVIDAEGRKEANETRWLLHVAEHERGVLAELLKTACNWLPHERAEELRRRYKEAQPPSEG